MPEEARVDTQVQNAGQPVVDLILEFLFSIAKPYRNAILKSFVKSLFNESQAFIREKQSESALELSYSSNVYQNDHLLHNQNVPSVTEKEQKPSLATGDMELEGEGLSEEDLYRLAIEMSLSNQEKEQQQQASEIVQELPPQEPNFYFFRFDASEDLFKSLLQKTTELSTTLEENGIIFKFIYKILKMQQLVCYKAQIPININFVNSFADAVYNQVFFLLELIL